MVRVLTNHHSNNFVFRFVKTRTGASGESTTKTLYYSRPSATLLCLQTEIGVVTRRHGSCPHEPSWKSVFRFVKTRTGASGESSSSAVVGVALKLRSNIILTGSAHKQPGWLLLEKLLVCANTFFNFIQAACATPNNGEP